MKVLVEGLQRAKTLSIEEQETQFSCDVMPLEPDHADSAETEALRRAIVSQFDQYVKLNKKIPPEILTSLSGIDEAGRLADTIAAHLPLKLDQKQHILEMFPVIEASRNICSRNSKPKSTSCRSKSASAAREAPDGEEPARVLPERAGQGDPEGTGRRRRRRGSRRAREAHHRLRACRRKPRRRPTPS